MTPIKKYILLLLGFFSFVYSFDSSALRRCSSLFLASPSQKYIVPIKNAWEKVINRVKKNPTPAEEGANEYEYEDDDGSFYNYEIDSQLGKDFELARNHVLQEKGEPDSETVRRQKDKINKFKNYPPFGVKGVDIPLFDGANFQEIKLDNALSQLQLPGDYYLNHVYTWNRDITQTDQAFQFVLAHDGLNVAQLKFFLDRGSRTLEIGCMETIPEHQKKGLANVLLNLAYQFVMNEKDFSKVHFSLSYSNYQKLLASMYEKKNLEEALGTTVIGRFFLSQGFKILYFSPNETIHSKYPQYGKETPSPLNHTIMDEPHFWLIRK